MFPVRFRPFFQLIVQHGSDLSFSRVFIPDNPFILAGTALADPLATSEPELVVGSWNSTAVGRVARFEQDVPRAWFPNSRNRIIN